MSRSPASAKGDQLRAANDRRQFALAVGQRRTHRFSGKAAFIGKDTQIALPRAKRRMWLRVAKARSNWLLSGTQPAALLKGSNAQRGAARRVDKIVPLKGNRSDPCPFVFAAPHSDPH